MIADLSNVHAVLKDQHQNDRSGYATKEEYDAAYAAWLSRRLEIISKELRRGR